MQFGWVVAGRWRSVAVRSCVAAFCATHVPLLGLIAVIVIGQPQLSPATVIVLSLVLTLAATAFIVTYLWRLFRPLRLAADGLHSYMAQGRLTAMPAHDRDEIGRFVGVLARALAHWDRARAPMLSGGALMIARSAQDSEGGLADGWMVLVEADQMDQVDRDGELEELVDIHRGLERGLQEAGASVVLPWGRGRFLAIVTGAGSDVAQRLESLCLQVPAPRTSRLYTATAVLEARESGSRAWAAGLQRLESKLYEAKAGGMQAVVC
jgi:hypothetical protein